MTTIAVAPNLKTLKPGQKLEGDNLSAALKGLNEGTLSPRDAVRVLFELTVDPSVAEELATTGLQWMETRGSASGAELISTGSAAKVWSDITYPEADATGPAHDTTFTRRGEVTLSDGATTVVTSKLLDGPQVKALQHQVQFELATLLITDHSPKIRAAFTPTTSNDIAAEINTNVDRTAKNRLNTLIGQNANATITIGSETFKLSDLTVGYTDAAAEGGQNTWNAVGVLKAVGTSTIKHRTERCTARSKQDAEQEAAGELIKFIETQLGDSIYSKPVVEEQAAKKPDELVVRNGDYYGALISHINRTMKDSKLDVNHTQNGEGPEQTWSATFSLTGATALDVPAQTAKTKKEATKLGAKAMLDTLEVKYTTAD